MNETELALIEAFNNYTFTKIEEEYRIYYDPITKECISKTTSSLEGTFIIVDRDTYESVIFCPEYIIKNNKPERKPVDYSAGILLSLGNTGQITMRGYNMIIVNDDYSGPVEYWIRKE